MGVCCALRDIFQLFRSPVRDMSGRLQSWKCTERTGIIRGGEHKVAVPTGYSVFKSNKGRRIPFQSESV
jgi:hypothetical protein